MYTTKNILDDLSLLGLKEVENEKQIKYSWKKTLKKVHPDIGGDTLTSQRVNEAYEKLMNFVHTHDQKFLEYFNLLIKLVIDSLNNYELNSYCSDIIICIDEYLTYGCNPLVGYNTCLNKIHNIYRNLASDLNILGSFQFNQTLNNFYSSLLNKDIPHDYYSFLEKYKKNKEYASLENQIIKIIKESLDSSDAKRVIIAEKKIDALFSIDRLIKADLPYFKDMKNKINHRIISMEYEEILDCYLTKRYDNIEFKVNRLIQDIKLSFLFQGNIYDKLLRARVKAYRYFYINKDISIMMYDDIDDFINGTKDISILDKIINNDFESKDEYLKVSSLDRKGSVFLLNRKSDVPDIAVLYAGIVKDINNDSVYVSGVNYLRSQDANIEKNFFLNNYVSIDEYLSNAKFLGVKLYVASSVIILYTNGLVDICLSKEMQVFVAPARMVVRSVKESDEKLAKYQDKEYLKEEVTKYLQERISKSRMRVGKNGIC